MRAAKGTGVLAGFTSDLTFAETQRSNQAITIGRTPVPLSYAHPSQKNFGPFLPSVLTASCLAYSARGRLAFRTISRVKTAA